MIAVKRTKNNVSTVKEKKRNKKYDNGQCDNR
jgi:hypothetical protein